MLSLGTLAVGRAENPRTEALESRIGLVSQIAASCSVALYAEHGEWGSGVLVSHQGHIFTAGHVVDEVGEEVQVKLPNGRTMTAAVMRINRTLDLAVLKLRQWTPDRHWTAPRLEEIDPFKDGAVPVVAAGHAYGSVGGAKPLVRFGVACHDQIQSGFLSTCRLTAGDSGGALFNLGGRLTGIHLSVELGGQRFARHVAITQFLETWNDLEDVLNS